MWVRTPEEAAGGVGEEGEPGMGIRFLYDSDGQRRAFEESVETLMKESLGEHLYRKLLGRE